jgi:hypothetical protein
MKKKRGYLDKTEIADMLDDSDDGLPKIDIYPEESDDDGIVETEYITRDLNVFVGEVVRFIFSFELYFSFQIGAQLLYCRYIDINSCFKGFLDFSIMKPTLWHPLPPMLNAVLVVRYWGWGNSSGFFLPALVLSW